MSRLIARDSLDVVVKGGVVTSIGKVLLGEVGETLHVELVLEMLEGESIVENDTVVETRVALLDGRSGGGEASGSDSEGGREVHVD